MWLWSSKPKKNKPATHLYFFSSMLTSRPLQTVTKSQTPASLGNLVHKPKQLPITMPMPMARTMLQKSGSHFAPQVPMSTIGSAGPPVQPGEKAFVCSIARCRNAYRDHLSLIRHQILRHKGGIAAPEGTSTRNVDDPPMVTFSMPPKVLHFDNTEAPASVGDTKRAVAAAVAAASGRKPPVPPTRAGIRSALKKHPTPLHPPAHWTGQKQKPTPTPNPKPKPKPKPTPTPKQEVEEADSGGTKATSELDSDDGDVFGSKPILMNKGGRQEGKKSSSKSGKGLGRAPGRAPARAFGFMKPRTKSTQKPMPASTRGVVSRSRPTVRAAGGAGGAACLPKKSNGRATSRARQTR